MLTNSEHTRLLRLGWDAKVSRTLLCATAFQMLVPFEALPLESFNTSPLKVQLVRSPLDVGW